MHACDTKLIRKSRGLENFFVLTNDFSYESDHEISRGPERPPRPPWIFGKIIGCGIRVNDEFLQYNNSKIAIISQMKRIYQFRNTSPFPHTAFLNGPKKIIFHLFTLF